MYRDCCAAISLLALTAVLCMVILHGNRNSDDHRNIVPDSSAPSSAQGFVGIGLLDRKSARQLRQVGGPRVPISPDELKAELQDWADNDFLISLVPHNIQVADRRDVAQEAWCRISQCNPGTIKDPAYLRAYAATVVERLTIEFFFGRRRVHKIVHVRGSDAFLEQECAAAGKVVDSLEVERDQKQREALFYRELETLPRAQRQTLELLRIEGLPAEEVARRRGVTVATVYSDARDAVLRLRKIFRKLGESGRDKRPRRDKP